MSGILPANTTLQLSNTSGDITHQGVLGSNASGSTLLTTFPTTSTGTSKGHYHFTESTTNSLKVLNASGTGNGGHQFWHSSSTQSPIKVLETNRNGTFINSKFDVSDTFNKSILQPDNLNISNSSTNNNITLVNDINNPALTLTNTNFQQGIYSTGWIQLVNNDNNSQFISQSSQQVISQNTNSSTSTPTQLRYETIGENNAILISNSNSPIIRLSNDTTGISVLSSTDLTFDGISLPIQVSTNTSNIATNTSNIATNTSSISTLAIKQTNSLQVYSSPAIYADGRPPASVPSASSNIYAQFGWYFKNSTTGYKINWYMPPATGMKVSDILGLYMRYFNCSTTSNDNSPFLTVYTVPTGSGDFFPGFFHSSMTYIINTTPLVNTSYTMFMNASGTCPTPSAYASNIQSMIQSPVNNPRGVYAPTESVLAFVIGTNSASAVNSVEFIAQKLGIMSATGTQELLYQTI